MLFLIIRRQAVERVATIPHLTYTQAFAMILKVSVLAKSMRKRESIVSFGDGLCD